MHCVPTAQTPRCKPEKQKTTNTFIYYQTLLLTIKHFKRMKKNFLLLLWMTLLPLAGWAQTPATLRTVPETVSGLYYDGTDKAITTPLTAVNYQSDYQINHGGVRFVVKTAKEDPTDEEKDAAQKVFTASFTAKDAGYHYIYYQVLGDGTANYSDGEWLYLGAVYINKGIRPSVAPTGAENLVYSGSAQQLITAAGIPEGDDNPVMEYKVGTGAWVTSIDELKETNVGTYVVDWQVAETANWEKAEGSVTVTIAPFDVTGKVEMTWDETSFTYNGAAQNPTNITLTGKDGENVPAFLASDYTLNYGDNKNVKDECYAQADFTGNFTGNIKKEFKIAPLSIVDGEGNLAANFKLKDSDMTSANASVYTGAEIKPAVSLMWKGSSLIKDAAAEVGDYNRTYENNIDASNEAVIKYTAKNNFTGEYTWKFKISPKAIGEASFTDISNQQYKGEAYDLAVLTEGKVTFGGNALVYGTDFDAVSNKNLKDVATQTITFTGKGNWTGTTTKTFDITKAPLTVKADDKEKFFGDADPETTYTLDGFVAPDTKDNVEITGTPTITRASGEDVNEYAYIVDASGMSATNYSFAAAAEQGKLTIKATALVFTITEATKAYGYKVPALNELGSFAYTASGLKSGNSITAITWSVKDKDGNEKAADEMLVPGTYTISATSITTNTGSYVPTITPATLTINPLVIKFVAAAQSIAYPAGAPKLDKNGNFGGEPNVSWNNDRLEMWYGEDEKSLAKITSTTPFYDTYKVWKQDFVESLTWEPNEGQTEKSIAYPGQIVVNLADYDKTKYTVITVPGTVEWTGVSYDITLTRVAKADVASQEVSSTIEKYNKAENINVTIKYNDADDYNTFKAEQWYTMVLPFNATVREISAAFGYAVVDVIDETNTDKNKMAFKLVMGDIPANTPFIVKVDQPIDMTAVDAVKFTNKTIVNPADEAALTQTDAAGNKFIGSYTGIDGLGAAVPGAWWFSLSDGGIKPASATGYLRQLSAYMILNPEAKAPVFEIEEPDGMTTTIKAIDFAKENAAVSAEGWYTINGVKLVGAPTEKGVYIKDGKKVVIK